MALMNVLTKYGQRVVIESSFESVFGIQCWNNAEKAGYTDEVSAECAAELFSANTLRGISQADGIDGRTNDFCLHAIHLQMNGKANKDAANNKYLRSAVTRV